MAVVPGLKCVWSRQVRHSVHEPETYLHSKLLNLTRSVTLWTSPPGSLRPHEDGSPSLGRRGTHFRASGDQRFLILLPFCHSLHLSVQMVDLAIKLGHSILECFLNNSRRRQHSTAIVKLGHGTTRRELAEIEREKPKTPL